MPIDQFSKTQFEAALPIVGGQPLWTALGLRNGEHCYVVPVKPGVLIYVRSSVDTSGVAAAVAEDSIRCWLASDDKGTPLGSKESRWIARTNGWDRRMIETLRTLWKIGRQIDRCGCGEQMLALKVKKDGPTKGQWFSKCPKCATFGTWLKTA